MSGRNISSSTNPEVRAAFLASLEYGVNPLARADYSPMHEEVVRIPETDDL